MINKHSLEILNDEKLNKSVDDISDFRKTSEIIYRDYRLIMFIQRALYQFKMNNLTVTDVINEVLIRLFSFLKSGEQITNLRAWARAVSLNYIRESFRKEAKYVHLSQQKAIELLEKYDAIKFDYQLPFNEEKIEDKEEIEEIYQKINLLKPSNRKIILWRFFENMSWEQIAELLSSEEVREIKPATARKRGERALVELRNLYVHNVTNQFKKQEISAPITVNKQENTEESDLVKEIRQKIYQLNPAEQKLLTWHFIDNLPWIQVAELLSKEEGNTISTAAVRKRGERAMRKLKETHVENI